MKRDRQWYLKRIKPFGLVLWYLGVVKLFKNGDGVGVIWRWWHPITWIHFIIFIPICAFLGEKITEVIPLRLDGYWREKKINIEWL